MKNWTSFKIYFLITILLVLLFFGFYLFFNVDIKHYQNFYISEFDSKYYINYTNDLEENINYPAFLVIKSTKISVDIILVKIDENSFEIFFNSNFEKLNLISNNALIKIPVETMKFYQWMLKF
ncbi:hypothetical protein [Mycoplasma anserisalpingitidis]|uniref:hypothetical protein n=1 Tax=Mycoplasma anserisalpingitidis TaxID=519450 RepID=UPI001CF660D8|nr:hypothetical protein [Mycoplasma anserisalpingitidis]UCU26786.1 hypothetical protein K7D06_00440 [Mycoplasma anserisalpingitidis]UCU27625.1 hypothetical protein K9O38_01110 [Mycoplasma anserisalpingitidis]